MGVFLARLQVLHEVAIRLGDLAWGKKRVSASPSVQVETIREGGRAIRYGDQQVRSRVRVERVRCSH